MKTLQGRTIVLGVTGSIAAVETVKLVHEIRRKGGTVIPVMSEAASRIIHPDALTYAAGIPAITRISGMVEHVQYCGEGGAGDLLLIAPSTANTLCKIASGIDDTPVTTFATTAIGRGMPVLVAPAMHESMFNHPGVVESIGRLRSWNIDIISPRIEEGRAKIAGIDEIVLHCERALFGSPLAGWHVLVTSGPCQEQIDDVRILTTRSSGRMGQALALHAYRLGAEVTLVHNGHTCGVDNVLITSSADMRDAVHRICGERSVDLYVSAAAVSDFAPDRHRGKIRSGRPASIRLIPQPKLISEVMETYHIPVVAFKVGSDQEKRARDMIASGMMMVAINGPEAMGSMTSEITLVGDKFERHLAGTKEEVAAAIWDTILAECVSGTRRRSD